MKAVVLVNLGSPSSPSVTDVRSYLKEFLTDPNVITLPWFFRYLLVYGIIAPIRSFKSSRLYQKLWREEGFPLITHSQELHQLVKARLEREPEAGPDLFLAMRYGEPSLKSLVGRLNRSEYDELLIVPLYPQFASSTTGSMIRLLQKELAGSPQIGRASCRERV
jgi:protoporphyrin/coproporphyrin ferrochelatase